MYYGWRSRFIGDPNQFGPYGYGYAGRQIGDPNQFGPYGYNYGYYSGAYRGLGSPEERVMLGSPEERAAQFFRGYYGRYYRR